jgi:putative two-component system response regulator
MDKWTNQKYSQKVLLVDDERQLLESMRRSLGKRYQLTLAGSGAEALGIIASQGPFAVVVSDLKMPNMNGTVFLERTRQISPDSVRIMLTGQADREQLIEAINGGYLFRFLEKPVLTEQLTKAIDDGLLQYRRVVAEKELYAAQKKQNLLTGVVNGFVRLMEARDPYTAGHQEWVADWPSPSQWNWALHNNKLIS